MKYAGIGSRYTPPPVLEQMRWFGYWACKQGWLLRSGGADGADTFFEYGADMAAGATVHALKEIYLPWKGFNHHPSPLFGVSVEAKALAASVHPNWSACSFAAVQLLSRNCYQIFGPKLDDPVDLVVCWTKAAASAGGTAIGINLALNAGIKVINLATGGLEEYGPEIEKEMALWKEQRGQSSTREGAPEARS